ncbi:arginase family protein [Chitinophaga pendula]|uniref:arginase family protein n=1 Tax=Chitinophaga TaxID=79328 RepID=UPI000BAF454A|nr:MULTISPECIES: arginase family protein [Chitinophaga]ASZ13394.1 arginase [Chitinophaga sp. MD30]UCJ08982.1 arginase family protein [Chitinophaga pendula]
MQIKEKFLIAAPVNVGLKAPIPGVAPGVRQLPAALAAHDFNRLSGIRQSMTVAAPPYNMQLDRESGVLNADAVAAYSLLLAEKVGTVIEEGYLPVVIGGDCSILLGNTLALKRRGRYGLFFMDGHTDYALPVHSASKAAAGIDLALVTGNGPAKLANIDNAGPYIQEEHVFSFGNRDFDPTYVAFIRESGIYYYDLPAVRAAGILPVTAGFLQMVSEQELDGFWIHLDVDVLDDAVMPCVDSREEGGLTYTELAETLQPLLASPLCAGIEITILDPTLDTDGQVVRTFVDEMSTLLRAATPID